MWNFCLNFKTSVWEQKQARHLDLIHVHDGLGGSLGPQTVADALIQSHAVKLAVVRCPPAESTGKGSIVQNMWQSSESINAVKHGVCWFSVSICFCTRSFLCWRLGWRHVQSDRRSAHNSSGHQHHTYYQDRRMRAEGFFCFGFGFLND